MDAPLNMCGAGFVVGKEKEEMSTDLVSVIMSVYNTPVQWLKEAVSSILNQTYKNIELLIVDDNSDGDLFSDDQI